MFGLGEDAGPCLEEGAGVGDGMGEGLESAVEYAENCGFVWGEKGGSYVHVSCSFLQALYYALDYMVDVPYAGELFAQCGFPSFFCVVL